MAYGLYLSAAGAQAQSERLELLAHNLANADTPGFKRELAVLEARHSEAIARGEDHPGSRSINDLGGSVQFGQTVTDLAPGPLKHTNRPTDLAIEGPEGFFLVEQDGRQLVTRAGNFRFSPEGQLVTEQGATVLSEEGEPIVIDPGLPWRVLPQGEIAQGADGIPLALVKPPSPGDLARAGQSLFLPLGPLEPLAPEQRRVRSGYLEQSTVKPVLEMMQLLEASRAYEANVRLIQHHDQMQGTLVSRILRTN